MAGTLHSTVTAASIVGLTFAFLRSEAVHDELDAVRGELEARDAVISQQQASLVHHELAVRELQERLEADGVQLRERLDKVHGRIELHESRIADLAVDVDDISEGVATIQERLEKVEGDMGVVQQAVGLSGRSRPIEFELDLVSTGDLLQGCADLYPSMPWRDLSQWAEGELSRGASCRSIALAAVKGGKLEPSAAASACRSALGSRWALTDKKAERLLGQGLDCEGALAQAGSRR